MQGQTRVAALLRRLFGINPSNDVARPTQKDTIMLHIPFSNKGARLLTIQMVLVCLAASITIAITAFGRQGSQESQTSGVLDLTAEVPRTDQGYPGIPGMSGGGGGWRPGPTDTQRYRLPLAVEILHASPNKDGNFVLEILVRNTDSTPFDLPNSRNITAVEKPGNRSRRVFFFRLQPAGRGAHSGDALGSAATGASTSIPGSFISLDPGKSLRLLLLASSESLRRSFTRESEGIAVKVTCDDRRLDDNRFFLSGISDELASVNTLQFALRGDQVAPIQP